MRRPGYEGGRTQERASKRFVRDAGCRSVLEYAVALAERVDVLAEPVHIRAEGANVSSVVGDDDILVAVLILELWLAQH